jgi:uncharacterized repeat protein (TIGR02543 family)
MYNDKGEYVDRYENLSFVSPRYITFSHVNADFEIYNAQIGSNTSFSNFLLIPSHSLYMKDTLPANQRTNTCKWNMPTPTREGYTFMGWNTRIDGLGKMYTSADPFPTEDTILYSQWKYGTAPPIYVGSTKALRMYVGATEVSKIV